jgi:hypothetical protein
MKKSENTIEINENYWQCDRCSVNNEELTRRCEYCGEPRFSRGSFSTPFTETVEPTIKNEYVNKDQKVHQFKPLHSTNQGNF